MSEERHCEKETARVVRLLEPLAAERAGYPPSDAVYWRARARLVLDESSRRQDEALRPLRLFQRAIGVGAVALAALLSVWPLFVRVTPGPVGLLAPPLLIALFAFGAHLLTEAGPLRPVSLGGSGSRRR